MASHRASRSGGGSSPTRQVCRSTRSSKPRAGEGVPIRARLVQPEQYGRLRRRHDRSCAARKLLHLLLRILVSFGIVLDGRALAALGDRDEDRPLQVRAVEVMARVGIDHDRDRAPRLVRRVRQLLAALGGSPVVLAPGQDEERRRVGRGKLLAAAAGIERDQRAQLHVRMLSTGCATPRAPCCPRVRSPWPRSGRRRRRPSSGASRRRHRRRRRAPRA